jgi:hypothetical protein
MKPLKLAAIVLILVAVLMTGLGGILDIIQNDFRITREHSWNDGLFLIGLAIALLLL